MKNTFLRYVIRIENASFSFHLFCFLDLKMSLKVFALCVVAVFIRNEESDFATWAYFEEGRQWGGGVRFLSPAALETGRGGAQPATLHLGRQYVQCTSVLFLHTITFM